MNKTQKGAWFCLIATAALLTWYGVFILAGTFPSGKTWSVLLKTLSFLAIFFMGMATVWLRIKQSPAEVNSDERDELIKKRAVLVSFASVWILLIATTIIPWFAVGQDGSIPVCLLPIINFGVFLIVALVHSVAVLVQYGWGGKDGEK